jgi:hypothetical protein
VSFELLPSDELEEIFRALGEIEYLLLVGELSCADRHAIQKRFDFGKSEGVASEDARIPDVLREHSDKPKRGALDGGARQLPGNGAPIPGESERVEQSHDHIPFLGRNGGEPSPAGSPDATGR